jgi:hypothetical protein
MKNILTFLLVLNSFSTVFSQADEFETMPYIKGDLLLMVDDNANISHLVKEYETVNGIATNLKINRQLSEPTHIWLLNFNHEAISHIEMQNALSSSQHVIIIQNNHMITERLTPNDSSYGNQWHHNDGASDNDMDSDLAWDITTGGQTANGDDIVVCVLEGGGANWNHPDLIDNHWTNTNEIPGNGIDDDNNGYIDDVDGWNAGANNDNIATGNHGTGVSGLIGAKGNNNNQVTGINWDVKIMQVDMANGLSESNVISAYTYPLVMRKLYNSTNGANGAFVVATNASWGIDNGDPASAPLWCAFYDSLGIHGILNFGATANNNVNIDVVGDLPTACGSDYMISVTATNSSDVRTFSGYGQTTIDLAAPGQSVLTTTGISGTGSSSGTSYATPLTAGVCGLIYAVPCSNLANLAISSPQAAANIVRSAILDGTDPVANLATETVTGGRLNAFNSCVIVETDCATYTCGQIFTANAIDETCAGDCTGETTISGAQNTGNYTYNIGAGAQLDSVFTDLCAGNYVVIIDDGVDCSYSLDVTINSPEVPTFTATTNPETFGNDGSINLTVSGGLAPFTYSWTGPSGFTSNIENPSGLEGGDYVVTITDANGCSTTSDIIVVSSALQTGNRSIEFSIFPNPAKDFITITLSNDHDMVQMVLVDNAGNWCNHKL